MGIEIRNNYFYPAKFRGKTSKPSANSKAEVRNKLSRELFGNSRITSAPIAFGWSQNISQEAQQILDVLTDPQYKVALVVSHSNPDGDSYGSSAGIAGLLTNMGKTVHSIIDDRHRRLAENLPSPDPDKSVLQYTKTPYDLEYLGKTDVAVITDCSEPLMVKNRQSGKLNKVFDLIERTAPKKIIIIDHHIDQEGELTSKEKWIKEFKKRGFAPEDILYWRENRASASEMVAELDEEVAKESKIRQIPRYNQNGYNEYRLATAVGILADADGIPTDKGEVDKTKFFRMSYKQVNPDGGKPVSTTRHSFEWLINNCGIPKSEVDMSDLLKRASVDKQVEDIIQKVVNNEIKIQGINVKVPTKDDPLGYIYIYDPYALKRIARMDPNQRMEEDLVFNIMKTKMNDKIKYDTNAGIYILANRGYNKKVTLSVRSYGYDYAMGEMYIPGHVFCSALALKIVGTLEKIGLGSGGGHKNSAGFRFDIPINFERDVVPIIRPVIKEYMKDKDIREIPRDKYPVKKGENINIVT